MFSRLDPGTLDVLNVILIWVGIEFYDRKQVSSYRKWVSKWYAFSILHEYLLFVHFRLCSQDYFNWNLSFTM